MHSPQHGKRMGPLGGFGIAQSYVVTPGYAGLLDPITGEPMEGGGGGSFSMGFGGQRGVSRAQYENHMAQRYANTRIGTGPNDYGYTGQGVTARAGINAVANGGSNPYVNGSNKPRGPLTYGGYNTSNQFGSNPSKNYGVPNSSGQRFLVTGGR